MTKIVNKVDGFTYTTSIKKLRKLKKRTKIIPGGSSAGKTFGILPILIDRAAKTPLLEISVVSESVPHLRKGALKDFLKIMKATGRYIDSNYNRTLLTYNFSNGSYIEFFSADQEDKVRGPRRNILYINECNNINFETYHQLAIRTSHEIWLDFNPSNEFWAYTELKGDEDVEWLTLTYKDNEALHPAIVKEIEKAKIKAYNDPEGNIDDDDNIKSKYWANWWKVYGLGLLGSLEGVIFDWEIKELPKECTLLGFGQDFGFTNDPTTLTAIYISSGDLYFDEWIYETGMTNNDISDRYKKLGVSPLDTIVADSAEPKSIEELYQLKWNIEGAEKGPDSIKNGIDILKRYNCFITPRSTNIIKEVRGYCWDTDKNGNRLNKPVDYLNHAIDGIRYFALNKLGHNFTFEFTIK